MALPVYLYVTPFFPSPDSWRGGYCFDFVKGLMRIGKYDVHVFVGGDGRDYEYEGLVVHTFPIRRLPSNVLPFLFRRKNARNFLKKVAECGIQIEDVTVCHANTANYGIYPLAIKAVNRKCLTLLHHHDPQSFGLNNGIFSHCWPYNVLQYPLLRRMHERIDCHVFISEQVRRSFLAVPDASWTEYGYYKKQMRGLGFYRSPKIRRSIILHNGVDISIFRSPLSQRINNTTFTIGCIGNFADWKGQSDLIAAFNILVQKGIGDIKLRFVGSGPCLERCKCQVKAYGLEKQIVFEKECHHSYLPQFYASLDLFVLPSWFEGFGCVFMEAWSCGVPFITCEGQGIEDLIPDEEKSHWLCRQRDPKDLASKIMGYFNRRYKQSLSGPIAIDELVSNYVAELEKVECAM